MRFSRLTLAVALPGLLVACSTQTNLMDQREMDALAATPSILDSAPICCKDFSEFTYLPIAVDKKTTFLDVVISTSAQAYDFKSGKSYFAAYKLPENKGRYHLTVESKIGDTTFKPQLIVLDSQYNVTRVVESSEFNMEKQFIGDEILTGFVKFDTSQSSVKSDETYFVVMTTEVDLQHKTKKVNWNKEFSKVKGVDPMPGMDTFAQHAPVGNLILSIAPTSTSSYFGATTILSSADIKPTGSETPDAVLFDTSVSSNFYVDRIRAALSEDDVKGALSWLKEAKYVGEVAETAFALSYAGRDIDEMKVNGNYSKETQELASAYKDNISELVDKERMTHALELVDDALKIGKNATAAFESKK